MSQHAPLSDRLLQGWLFILRVKSEFCCFGCTSTFFRVLFQSTESCAFEQGKHGSWIFYLLVFWRQCLNVDMPRKQRKHPITDLFCNRRERTSLIVTLKSMHWRPAHLFANSWWINIRLKLFSHKILKSYRSSDFFFAVTKLWNIWPHYFRFEMMRKRLGDLFCNRACSRWIALDTAPYVCPRILRITKQLFADRSIFIKPTKVSVYTVLLSPKNIQYFFSVLRVFVSWIWSESFSFFWVAWTMEQLFFHTVYMPSFGQISPITCKSKNLKNECFWDMVDMKKLTCPKVCRNEERVCWNTCVCKKACSPLTPYSEDAKLHSLFRSK